DLHRRRPNGESQLAYSSTVCCLVLVGFSCMLTRHLQCMNAKRLVSLHPSSYTASHYPAHEPVRDCRGEDHDHRGLRARFRGECAKRSASRALWTARGADEALTYHSVVILIKIDMLSVMRLGQGINE